MSENKRQDKTQHRVWDVYDLLRTVRLNEEYYVVMATRERRKQFWIELVIAITAPSSGVAVLTIWGTSIGGTLVWAVLALISAVLAVAKPLLKISESIQSYETAVTEYRSLATELDELRHEISQRGVYDVQMQEWFRHVYRRHGRVREKEPKGKPDYQIRDEYEEHIKRAYPPSAFYIPEE